jgi:hypothetical protein
LLSSTKSSLNGAASGGICIVKDGLMLKYDVLSEIIMLCASGVAMKNYAFSFNVKISMSFRPKDSQKLVMHITAFPGMQQT